MSTTPAPVQPSAPAQLGLSLHVVSGPRGEVRDDNWPSIGYNLELWRADRVIWSGPYFLGIGHVMPVIPGRFYGYLSDQERGVAERFGKVVAGVAAKLAKAQKVTPKLEDVLHSLLSDGSAYFDAQRFEDWAADLGYDPDSRKAEATWRACDETGRALARAFTPDELAGLREWASNY